MTVSIILEDVNNFPGILTASSSLGTVLDAVEEAGMAGSHPDTTGDFTGTITASNVYGVANYGSTYTYGNETLGYAVEITGNIFYYNLWVDGVISGATNHTVYGEITGITISNSLADFDDDALLSFTFSPGDLTSDLLDGQNTDVHNIIWDLMNGSTDALQSVLVNYYNIDLTDSVADLVANSPFSEEVLLLAA